MMTICACSTHKQIDLPMEKLLQVSLRFSIKLQRVAQEVFMFYKNYLVYTCIYINFKICPQLASQARFFRGLSQMANFKQPKYFLLCHQFLLHKPKNTECYHLGVHFNVTIVSLHVNFSCSFTGCVHGVKVECPHCGSGVQGTIGTIVALYRLMEMYNTKRASQSKCTEQY